MTAPFLGTEALASGHVSRRELNRHHRIYRDVYLPADVTLTAEMRAEAAWLWSDRLATTGGLSAAALYGTLWVDPRSPAELFRTNGKPVSGIIIHRDVLLPDEVEEVRGIPATTPARTGFDLGRRRGRERALVRVDALANQTGVTAKDIDYLIPRHRGVRGLVQLRAILELMDDGAESPQESRTRLALIDAGLPKPETQIEVHDELGEFVGRIDMGYREFKVGIEYDGVQHWDDPEQRAKDIERLARLLEAGWMIIRVSSDILRNRSRTFVVRTCQALRAAGAEWPVIARILGDRVY